jgi:copper resistance protein C
MPVTTRPARLFPWLTALALLLAAVAPVQAHADLATATPGPDETVQGSPDELVARFTEPLDAAVTSVVVVDADGAEVASGGEPGDAPEDWRLTLPELEPGVYEVRWTASSTMDAHLFRGRYTFTVVAAPTPTPTPAPTPTPEPSATAAPPSSPTPEPTPPPTPSPTATEQPPADPAADSSVLIPIAAALVLVAAGGAWLLRRRGA